MEFVLGLIGIIVGIISTLVYQVYQSKESIKQTIYKEKLIIYEKLMKSHAYIGLELSKSVDDKPTPDMNSLSKNNLEFFILINTYAHLLPRNILLSCFNFSFFLLGKTKIDKTDLQLIYDNNLNSNIYNDIREDLGMENLTKELNELFVSYPTLKIKKNLK